MLSGQDGTSHGDSFAVAANEIMQLTQVVIEATTDMDRLIDTLRQCLAGEETDMAESVIGQEGQSGISLASFPLSVEMLAKQIEKISQAAIVVSTESLSRMAQELQRVAHTKLKAATRN